MQPTIFVHSFLGLLLILPIASKEGGTLEADLGVWAGVRWNHASFSDYHMHFCFHGMKLHGKKLCIITDSRINFGGEGGGNIYWLAIVCTEPTSPSSFLL